MSKIREIEVAAMWIGTVGIEQIHLQRRTSVKTTISILHPFEHEILTWAINADFFGKTESNFPTGWASWDRTGVLNSNQLVLDWETPQVAQYIAFILLRLQDLFGDARDKYAETAKDLRKRICHSLKSQDTSGRELLFKTAASST